MKIFIGGEESRNQVALLPPCVEDYVPEGSPARIIEEIIDKIDTGYLVRQYSGGGAPAYHPVAMLKVLIFAYSQGIRSSRKVAALLRHDLRFMFLAEGETPDFRTLCRFRRKHLEDFERLFLATVHMARKMGLVLLRHAALDGTKLEADVSGGATYSRERLSKALEATQQEIAKILEEAELTDQAEDRLYGKADGNEVPKKLRKKQARLRQLECAQRELDKIERQSIAATDLESRVMKTTAGNRPAYNAQAVVDGAHQVIVAAAVTQEENDSAQFEPMMAEVQANLEALPEKVTADAGYYNQESLQCAESLKLDAYIAVSSKRKVEREYDAERDEYRCPAGKALIFCRLRRREERTYRIYRCYHCSGCASAKECHGLSSRYKELWALGREDLRGAMIAKLKSDAGKQVYRQRSGTVEPVFGNIKGNHGLRRLLLRGLAGAQIEYLLGCIVHNIGKLMRFWPLGLPEAAPA